jgi:hypothetical protein
LRVSHQNQHAFLFCPIHATQSILPCGHTIVRAVSYWSLNMKVWVQSLISLCWTSGGQSDTRVGFFLSILAFPCKYHSTNAPYSSIHLSDVIWAWKLTASLNNLLNIAMPQLAALYKKIVFLQSIGKYI